MRLSRLLLSLLRALLNLGAELAFALARRTSSDRFECAAGVTAAELEQFAGVLLDWRSKLAEVQAEVSHA